MEEWNNVLFTCVYIHICVFNRQSKNKELYIYIILIHLCEYKSKNMCKYIYIFIYFQSHYIYIYKNQKKTSKIPWNLQLWMSSTQWIALHHRPPELSHGHSYFLHNASLLIYFRWMYIYIPYIGVGWPWWPKSQQQSISVSILPRHLMSRCLLLLRWRLNATRHKILILTEISSYEFSHIYI